MISRSIGLSEFRLCKEQEGSAIQEIRTERKVDSARRLSRTTGQSNRIRRGSVPHDRTLHNLGCEDLKLYKENFELLYFVVPIHKL